MIKALFTASTGLNAQGTQVDVTANNLANLNTNGFKRNQVNFQDLIYVNDLAPGAVASCCGGATRGSRRRASHPRRPTAFRKLSVPRCASAICRQSTSPMPEPSGFVV